MSIGIGLLRWTTETLGALGVYGLFILAVIESIFFPIPVDVLLIILVALNPAFWWWFAIVAVVGSVLGAMVGYWLGYLGEIVLLERLFKKKHIEKVHNLFNKYETGAIFIAGFTPIPYKVFAVAAGVFYIRFWPFVITSFVARGLRFFIVAGVAAWVAQLDMSFPAALVNALTIFLVLLGVEAWIAWKLWWKKI
ncbi:DedA family protein [Candidatus Woesearchaeota archaeon]|nr:DedA family protein [Candidatus Woesearchaeota archaeon]